MKTGKLKKLSLSAEGSNLIKVRNFVVKYGRKMRLTPKQVSEVKLAVDEAVSNIIRHAYEGKKGGFQVEMIRQEDILSMKVYLETLGAPGLLGGLKQRFSIRVKFALYAVALITFLIVVLYNFGTRYQVRTIRNKFIDRYKSVTGQVAATSLDIILEGNDLERSSSGICNNNRP
jgi:hypothetical protein